jgi:hypothetical protein
MKDIPFLLTIISYQLPVSSLVATKVYDVLGREVQTLVNECQNAGNRSLTFSTSTLPSAECISTSFSQSPSDRQENTVQQRSFYF